MNNSIFFAAVFILFCSVKSLYPSPVILTDNTHEYPLGKSIFIYEDKTSTLSITDIMDPGFQDKFTLSKVDTPSFGFSQSTYWIRFDLENRTEVRSYWLLELAYPVMDSADLYYIDNNGQPVKKAGGDKVPFAKREFQHHNHIHVIPVMHGTTHTFYMSFRSNNSIVIPITVFTAEALGKKSYYSQFVHGLFYGILFIMILYNFMLFITIRDPVYLFYFIMIGGAAGYFMCLHGHASVYFWPASAWWADLAPVSILMGAVIFMLLFMRSYLRIKDYSKMLDKFVLGFVAAVGISLALSFVLNRYTSSILVTSYTMLTVCLSLVLGFYTSYNGYRPAKYFLLAWGIFLSTALLNSLRALGLLTQYFSILSLMQAGFVTSMVLFSMGLAYRINVEREQKEKARQDSLKNLALLEESEERFRQISEQSELLILIMQDGAIKYANEACARLYDTTLEKIYQWDFEKFKKIIHPDDYEYVTSQYMKKIKGEDDANPHYQYRAVTVTGRSIWIEHYSQVIHIGGKPALMVTQFDITEQKEAQEMMMQSKEELERKVAERTVELSLAYKSIQESEELFRALTENSSDVTAILDSNLNITYVSPAVANYGYNARSLIGCSAIELIHQDEIQTLGQAAKRAAKNKKQPVVIDEIRFKTKSGSWVHMETTIKDMSDTPGVNGTVVNCCDITEKKHAEKEQHKASKIESLAVFSGGIAHDFNNLLTAVIGNISLVKNLWDGDSKVEEILLEAEKASLRARSLTQQLLTFSRGGEPIKKVISLTSLIRENTEFALSGSNILCNYSIADDLWNVEADEGQISQVVHNLILNAREAMDGGTITVSSENINISKASGQLNEGNYVSISISDQGSGIQEDIAGNIFDPYFTTKENGSGLGLSVAYSIIKKHGGHLQVDPHCGSGTTFTFYLPSTVQSIDSMEQKIKGKSFNGEKILLMDDDKQVLKVGERILSQLGFDVLCSTHGEETVELYKEAFKAGKPFDVVIMDLTIPGCLGGKETVILLKEIDPHVRAIVSSGYSNDPVMANYNEYGFCGVVPKPYRFEDIVTVLNSVLKTLK